MSKTASGQVGPKNEKNRPPGKRVKRGRLHFTEEEVTRQAGEPTSGQVGPKPAGGGKFRQDEEREKPSSRLRQDDEASRDTAHEEQNAQKARKDKQEKKKERAEAKAEHSAVKLEAAKEKLAQQKPQKPPGLPQRAATAARAGVWTYTHRKIHEVEHIISRSTVRSMRPRSWTRMITTMTRTTPTAIWRLRKKRRTRNEFHQQPL